MFAAERRVVVRPALRSLLVTAAIAAVPDSSAARPGSIGLSTLGSHTIGATPIAEYLPDPGDGFGSASAVGDFNADGVDDLAIGIPGHSGPEGSSVAYSGIVVVRFGVPNGGLTTGLRNVVLSQHAVGSLSPPEANENFGWALAAGDFNADGFDDLAVGVPWDWNLDVIPSAPDVRRPMGAVDIFYGLPDSWGGIQLVAEHHVYPEHLGGATGGTNWRFGAALAVGNFNGDSYDDLAVSAPWAVVSGADYAGIVYVLHGRQFGLYNPLSGFQIDQSHAQIADTPEAGDTFGETLVAASFNGDGYDDLAIGVPGENSGAAMYAGAVQVLIGSVNSLTFSSGLFLRQSTWGGESAEANDIFGRAMAAGDLDGDGNADLVVSAEEDLEGSGISNTGSVTVLFGANVAVSPWFTPGRTRQLTQGSIHGDPAADGANEVFGFALAIDDFDGDGFDDLAAAHPYELVDGAAQSGAVSIVMGAGSGTWPARTRQVRAGHGGIQPSAQAFQFFGETLVAGDFDASGEADLVIGAPSRDENDIENVGLVTVLYGSLFSDGFESADRTAWFGGTP